MTETAATSPEDVNAVERNLQSEKGSSLWKDAYKRLIKNKAAVVSFFFVVFMVIASVAGPWVIPHLLNVPAENRTDYANYQDYARVNNPPFVTDIQEFERTRFVDLIEEDFVQIGPIYWNTAHPFGTDDLGRDLLIRVLEGGRVSLMVGFLAAIVSLIIGVLYGSIAGYVGGRTDNIMMRFVDTLYALPYMFFVIFLMAVFGRNFYLLFIAIGAVSWLTTARIVRGQVISLKNSEFIEAAHACGTGHSTIILRHLIPNTIGLIIVYFSLIVPRVMLEEAFLSFLGLGVQAPMASWGALVRDGQTYLTQYPWMVIFPGFALTLTLFSLNFFGDGLRDALDPKLKGKS